MLLRALCIVAAGIPLWAGGAHIDVQFTPASPTLSDVVRMEVTLTGTEDPDVVLRPIDIPPDCVTVQNSSPGGIRAIILLEPVKPGPCRIPAFRTRCLHGATSDCDVRSAETVIPIGTMVAKPEEGDIRDKDETPVEFSGRVRGSELAPPVLWASGLAALMVIVACFFYWRWRARRDDPVRQAEKQLRELAMESGVDSDPTAAYSRITDIFRQYLDQRLAPGAMSHTSPELLDTLRRQLLHEGATTNMLRDFLALCDRAKFAGVDAAGNVDDAAKECLELIQSLEFYTARRSRVSA